MAAIRIEPKAGFISARYTCTFVPRSPQANWVEAKRKTKTSVEPRPYERYGSGALSGALYLFVTHEWAARVADGTQVRLRAKLQGSSGIEVTITKVGAPAGFDISAAVNNTLAELEGRHEHR